MENMNKDYIKQISIQGFRGFKEKQTINFAYPSKNCKSGLNILVGQNCSGKSTILECIKLLNTKYGDNGYFLSKLMKHNNINLEMTMNTTSSVSTLTSYDNKYYAELKKSTNANGEYFFVPAKKNIANNNLYSNSGSIQSFIMNNQYNSSRTINRRKSNLNNEYISALTIIYAEEKLRTEFNKIFNKFFPNTTWNLYMSDEQENSFVVDITDDSGETHLEGVGDGLITILYICIGLLLLKENYANVLLIDEPEVSLHTDLIKKISSVLSEYAKKYQIIISTHSPYLINWNAIQDGGKLIRVVNNGKIETYELDNYLIQDVCIEPSNNPHIYGTTAKEVFFLKDNIILVEGQEDVVCYRKVINRLGIDKEYNFYGWGTGGATNLMQIMKILNSLGYKKVVALFDGDEAGLKSSDECKNLFGEKYLIENINAEDIRDKYKIIYHDSTGKEEKIIFKKGICDQKFRIKTDFNEKYSKYMSELFKKIDEYFNNKN